MSEQRPETPRVPLPKMFDICECGDFRHQHAEWQFECIICTLEAGQNHSRGCSQFRLHQLATWRSAHSWERGD